MIAVFGSENEFRKTDFFPKKNYKLIKSTEDVRGIKFEGLIIMQSRSHNEEKSQALQLIHVRHPELF